MDKKKKKPINYIIVFVIIIAGGLLTYYCLDENISQVIYMLVFLASIIWFLIKGLTVEGTVEIIGILGYGISPIYTPFLAKAPFAEVAKNFYNLVIMLFCKLIGINEKYSISKESSITVTVTLIFLILCIINKQKDDTVMKIRKGSREEEFKEKNYIEKREMFCKTLRQKLEILNRESDWNESLFTPMEAEVEVCIKGRKKKKYEDLLKCLKKIKHKNAIFLVLGEPGAGKSVSLRKLCLDLLDESKKTKKIPVYINLKKWNKNWNIENLPTRNDLIDFIEKELREDGDILTDEFLNTYFKKMFEDGRWYFVFDSFDEMPCLMGKNNCQELIDKISELLFLFMKGPNQSGGIIASRLYKSPSEALTATVTLKIQEFNDIKIKTMIQKYLNNADTVVNEIFGKREYLVTLCRNPFYLSLLINYIRIKGMEFPKNQMELYSSFVEERLKKCKNKLENEGLTTEDVHDAAKELANYMQNSELYGLECPMESLTEQDNDYWKKRIRILEYAKICRVGGQRETVSFVHRRFQEFLLVEKIIEENIVIEQEKYKSILNNSGLRDALVLYCEVAEEEKVKEIAGYCWDIIQNNMEYAGNIQNKECVELVNAFYFITEAFRNRKNIIKDLENSFEKIVEENLDEETDLIVLIAMVNSMVLFKQDFLQRMALKVFSFRNRWMNDIMMRNCRIFGPIDSKIESRFVEYLGNMDIRNFWSSFSNIQFSLSLTKSFKYVKVFHLSILLVDIFNWVMISILGLTVISQLKNSYILIIQKIHGFSVKDVFVNIIQIGEMEKEQLLFRDFFSEPFILLLLFYSLFILLQEKTAKIIRIRYRIFMIEYLVFSMFLIPLYFEKMVYIILIGMLFPIVLLGGEATIHDIKMDIKEGKIEQFGKQLLIILSGLMFYIVILMAASRFQMIFLIILSIILIVSIISLILIVGHKFYSYLKDKEWLKKQPEIDVISREVIVENLNKLKTKKIRYFYIYNLLQRKVELTGKWPENKRPKFKDDKLARALAELDCLKLDCCKYLF